MITFTQVAIGTTILLALYLAGMIVYDKRKQRKTSSGKGGEEFDVSFMEEEEKGVDVQESGDGFTLGTSKMETSKEEINQYNKEKIMDETASKSHGKPSAIEQKIGKVEDELEAIEPVGSAAMSKELFRDLLLNAHEKGSLFISKAS